MQVLAYNACWEGIYISYIRFIFIFDYVPAAWPCLNISSMLWISALLLATVSSVSCIVTIGEKDVLADKHQKANVLMSITCDSLYFGESEE